MTLNGVMTVTLCYFTVFGKPEFQHITTCARKKESLRSVSHIILKETFNCTKTTYSVNNNIRLLKIDD